MAKDKLSPEEKIAKEAITRATNNMVAKKRESLKTAKMELQELEEKHTPVLEKARDLRQKILRIESEIEKTEQLVTDVANTQKVKRNSSACV